MSVRGVEQACATCGTVATAHARFCVECGQPISSRPDAGSTAGSRGRARRWRVAAVAVLVLVGAALGDWAWRVAEMSALVSHVEASEAGMNRYNDALEGAYKAFEDAAVPDQSDAAQRFVETAQRAAADADATVIRENAAIDGLVLAPWHRSATRAREAYLDHGEAWIDHLEDVAVDGTRASERAPSINGTFLVVRDTLPAAVPPLAWGDLAARMDRIVAD